MYKQFHFKLNRGDSVYNKYKQSYKKNYANYKRNKWVKTHLSNIKNLTQFLKKLRSLQMCEKYILEIVVD